VKRAGLYDVDTVDTQTLRMLESTYVLLEVPMWRTHFHPRALASIAFDTLYRLLPSGVHLDFRDKCDEDLLNEGRESPTEGKMCMGVTKTGHHAHVLWRALYTRAGMRLEATVRFVRVRRVILEEGV
jgi:hypothetical protein